MSQQEASTILFLAAVGFTLVGNYIVGRVNAGRMLRHEMATKAMNEMFEQIRASNPGKKGSKKPPLGAAVEIAEPSLLGKFNFWLVLLMTIAIYSIMSAMH